VPTVDVHLDNLQTPPVHGSLYHPLHYLFTKLECSNYTELYPSLEGRIEGCSLPQGIWRYDRAVDMIFVGPALDAARGDAEHIRYALCDVSVLL
jgi:hypothetical protein